MNNLKPLVALIKAYRGGEWLEACLESVYKQCSGIVVVLSNSPWKDVEEVNHLSSNCQEPLAKFKRKYPNYKLIIDTPTIRLNTEGQYQLGMNLIRGYFSKNHAVLLLDTDEIWEEEDLVRLRESITNNPNGKCFRSGIFTYLRSPLWQVTPQEKAKVAVALANPSLPTGKSRLANIYDLYDKRDIIDVDCNFHHFGYVRLDQQEITSKLSNSTSQDKVPTRPNWKETVWDTLPYGVNLHPQKGFERCWGSVERVWYTYLPKSVTKSDAFWGGMIYHTGSILHEIFLSGNEKWRQEIEEIPHNECPITTVFPSYLHALNKLGFMLGHSIRDSANILEYLIPKLRMSFRETVQLAFLACQISNYSNVVEIGSGLGGSVATLMLSLPSSCSITAVDPYIPYTEENVKLDKNVREGSVIELEDTITKTLKITGKRNVSLKLKSSVSACKEFSDNSIDLLLVDGNHSYTSCLEDIEIWWDKVKSKGLVLVHDYAPRFPGVIKAVKEFEDKHKVKFSLPLGSTLAYLRKV